MEAELLGLAWEDVDFEAATLTIRHQLKRLHGAWVLAVPKNKEGRVVALTPEPMAALRDHQRRMAVERTPGWPFFGLMFVTERDMPIHGAMLLRMLHGHLDRL